MEQTSDSQATVLDDASKAESVVEINDESARGRGGSRVASPLDVNLEFRGGGNVEDVVRDMDGLAITNHDQPSVSVCVRFCVYSSIHLRAWIRFHLKGALVNKGCERDPSRRRQRLRDHESPRISRDFRRQPRKPIPLRERRSSRGKDGRRCE